MRSKRSKNTIYALRVLIRNIPYISEISLPQRVPAVISMICLLPDLLSIPRPMAVRSAAIP